VPITVDLSRGLLLRRRQGDRRVFVGVFWGRTAASRRASSVGAGRHDEALEQGGRVLHLGEQLAHNVRAVTTSSSPSKAVSDFAVPAVVAVVRMIVAVLADLVVAILQCRTSPRTVPPRFHPILTNEFFRFNVVLHILLEHVMLVSK